jgi:hypothetical protein
MRLHAQTGAIENGFVHVPKEAHWLAEYLHELTTFPASKHDDQIDSRSQFLDWSKRRPAGWGVYEYYGQLAENLNQQSGTPTVKLRAQHGTPHVITITGRAINVRRDRTIEVTEGEAKLLGLLVSLISRLLIGRDPTLVGEIAKMVRLESLEK